MLNLHGLNKLSQRQVADGIKRQEPALVGVGQWSECRPVNQRVAGSIPSQGSCLGCGPGPQLRACERQPRTDVSFPLSLSLPLSQNINKMFKKCKKLEK